MKALLVITFLGVLGGASLRTASAFKEVAEGVWFMASLALGFSAGRAVVSLISSKATNKYGSKVTALGFAALSLIGLGYRLGPPSLYPFLRFFHGVASGITWPSMQAVVMRLTRDDERAKVSSLYFFTGTSGAGLAYLIGALEPGLALTIFPPLLALLSAYMFSLSVKGGARPSKRVYAPASTSLVLMALSMGMINVIVNSEIAISILNLYFGRVLSGILLSSASAFGSLVSYVVGRITLDVKQSPISLVLPSVTALGSSSLILIGDPKVKALSIMTSQGAITWWRGVLTAAARSGDVGTRVGLVNFGRDLGNALGGLTVAALGLPGLLANLILSLILNSVALGALEGVARGLRRGARRGLGGPAGI